MSWKWGGFEITIKDSGEFVATLDDVELKATSLDDVRGAIDRYIKRTNDTGIKIQKEILSLPVVGYLCVAKQRRYGADAKGPITAATLIGVNRTTRELQFDGLPKGKALMHVLADSEANRKLLKDAQEAERRSEDLKGQRGDRSISPHGYGRIEPEAYPAVIKSIKDAHATSLSGKPRKKLAL